MENIVVRHAVRQNLHEAAVILLGCTNGTVHPHCAMRMIFFDKIIYTWNIPHGRRFVPDLAIICHKLGELATHIIYVFAEITIGISRFMPVPQGIIDAEFQSVFPACVGHSPNHICGIA